MDFCMSDKSLQSLSLTEPCESQGSFWEHRRAPVSHVPLETVTKATADPGIPVLLSWVSVISGDESFRILWASCMKRQRAQSNELILTTTQDMTVVTLGQNQPLDCWKEGTEERLFLFESEMWSAPKCRASNIFSQWELSEKYWRGWAVWVWRKRIPLKRVHNGAERATLPE